MKNLDVNSFEYWEKILEKEGLWDIDKKLWFSDEISNILSNRIDEKFVKIKSFDGKFEIYYKSKLAWVVLYEETKDWIYVDFLWTPNWNEKTLWHNTIFDNKYYEYFNEKNNNTSPVLWMWPYLFEKFFFHIAEKWLKIHWQPIEGSESFYKKCFDRMEKAWVLEFIFEDGRYEITPIL